VGEPQRVELSLLGQTLTVRTEATPAYLRSLARFLEDRVTTLQRSGVQDGGKALVLAALDIVDELFHAREERKKLDGDVQERLKALVALLEHATPGD
jgi:cell division protein ZapA (FtsZ GTPase activity inhibitor)